LSFRNYGGLLSVSGTTPDGIVQNVPAPAILAGHTDEAYPTRTSAASDTARAAEFVRDYRALALMRRAPRFAYVALPAGSATPGAGPTAASIAEGDRALGTIVEGLSKLPSWHTTAIVVVPADARSGRDHIEASRTFALVISPYAKHGYIGMHHLSTASILKFVDHAFSLPALSLGDLLASDMGDFFTSKPDLRPYAALPVSQPGS
jgi:phosphoesterase family protein